MKIASWTLVACLALAGTAAAAPDQGTATKNPYIGGNITREYSANDLKRTYGILDLAVGEIWVLNLPDTVVDVITARDGVLQFSQRGNRVVMGAIASSGSYPVLVMTADSVYFFQARLSPSRGGGVRNVIVRADEAPTEDQQMLGFPNTPAAPLPAPAARPASTLPAPTNQLRGAAVYNVSQPITAMPARVSLPVTMPAPVVAPAAVVPVPVAAIAVPRSSTTPAPDTTTTSSGQAETTVDYRALSNGQQTILYYRIVNTGTSDVVWDETALTLRNAVGPVGYTPIRREFHIKPGATEFGQVAVSGAQSTLTALWAGSLGSGQPQAKIIKDVTVERVN